MTSFHITPQQYFPPFPFPFPFPFPDPLPVAVAPLQANNRDNNV